MTSFDPQTLSPTRDSIGLFHREIAGKFRIVSFLVGGSSVREGVLLDKPVHENSDIDIVLVVEGEGRKTRGNMLIHGRKIEYFVFSQDVLEVELLREVMGNGRSLSRLVNGSITLYANDPYYDRAIRVARQVVEAPIPALSQVDRIQYYSRLRNTYEDMMDLGDLKSPAFRYVLVEYLQLACEVSLKLARHACPHRKRMMAELGSADPVLHGLVQELLTKEVQLETIRELFEHLSTQLGLNTTHDWEFSMLSEGTFG